MSGEPSGGSPDARADELPAKLPDGRPGGIPGEPPDERLGEQQRGARTISVDDDEDSRSQLVMHLQREVDRLLRR